MGRDLEVQRVVGAHVPVIASRPLGADHQDLARAVSLATAVAKSPSGRCLERRPSRGSSPLPSGQAMHDGARGAGRGRRRGEGNLFRDVDDRACLGHVHILRAATQEIGRWSPGLCPRTRPGQSRVERDCTLVTVAAAHVAPDHPVAHLASGARIWVRAPGDRLDRAAGP